MMLSCNRNGDFLFEDNEGKLWFYPREEWVACNKHFMSLFRPASGDPK